MSRSARGGRGCDSRPDLIRRGGTGPGPPRIAPLATAELAGLSGVARLRGESEGDQFGFAGARRRVRRT